MRSLGRRLITRRWTPRCRNARRGGGRSAGSRMGDRSRATDEHRLSQIKQKAMTVFPVNPDKEEQLARCMAALGVRESDIEETFVRSGGHGGQNVNKTATCVMLLHRPTRLQVKCQTTD